MTKKRNNNIGIETITEQRPWGNYTLLFANIDFKEHYISQKILMLNPKTKLSVQSHEHRGEYWYVIEGSVCAYRAPVLGDLQKALESLEPHTLQVGDSIIIPKKFIHSLENLLDSPARVLELSFGRYDEDDIVRYEDIYGRVR